MLMRKTNRRGSKKRLLLQGRPDYDEEVVAQEVTTLLTVWIAVCIFLFAS